MVLFEPPELDARELDVLASIERFKEELRWQLHEPRRWSGSLRRLSLARNMQGSNSIEGYVAELDDAAAVVVGEEPLDASELTKQALQGYRSAMTYVLQLASDEGFGYSAQLFKSLHFMMTSYDLKARPGLWRAGPVYVQREADGVIVYEGAPVGDVAPLMAELVAALASSDAPSPVVLGAMAHLNLVMVHPFRDGNGRMARCLQSLVLARGGALAPVFMSVEEYLGRNTAAYYAVLAEVGQGGFQPERSARPWVRFMLTAHLRQARTMLHRTRESEQLWTVLAQLTHGLGLPERTVTPLFDAAYGMRVRNATYRAGFAESPDEISEGTATRDLKQLVEHGLLVARGERRGRVYVGGDPVRSAMAGLVAARGQRDDTDPFG